jgi:hypothetical protein
MSYPEPKTNSSGIKASSLKVGTVVYKNTDNNIITDLTTARTFALTDKDKYIIFNNAGATTATIPTNATVAFPIGSEIKVFMLGAGVVTVTAAGGVTLQAVAGIPAMAQYEGFTLKKVGTDTWNMH